ncbi:MAG: hypothetical protein JO033_11535 [Acidobacteriaceae bacterium]|nr:hypothetical protein [Acidobacteriaceae bacterium]MBV9497823.1 hypothetical protein [Acidobacteriaceae bacterium]
MKLTVISSAAILLSMPITSTFIDQHDQGASWTGVANASDLHAQQTATNAVNQAGATANPCAAPTEITDPEETAWRLWVAATCPVNNNQYPFVVWENWLEQDQMYPLDPQNGLKVPNSSAENTTANLHELHASPLALIRNPGLTTVVPGLLGAADQNCNKSGTPPPHQPNLVICEEVRENGAQEDYIAGIKLWDRRGQQKLAAARADIEFPADAVEIKADWIQLSTIGLNCSSLSQAFKNSIHVEMIHGNCFALAGMHLMSKLLDNWVWATFEPQNSITNPERCKVLGCSDSFGSNPSESHGANTRLTQQLSDLMNAANLAPEWKNYRLDGVQITFTSNGDPTLLGNSIIEGENAGVPLKQSSCISCHAVSAIKSSDGSDGTSLLTNLPIGEPEPLPGPRWIRRDFVWSALLACPNGPAETSPHRDCVKGK